MRNAFVFLFIVIASPAIAGEGAKVHSRQPGVESLVLSLDKSSIDFKGFTTDFANRFSDETSDTPAGYIYFYPNMLYSAYTMCHSRWGQGPHVERGCFEMTLFSDGSAEFYVTAGRKHLSVQDDKEVLTFNLRDYVMPGDTLVESFYSSIRYPVVDLPLGKGKQFKSSSGAFSVDCYEASSAPCNFILRF